MEGLLRLNIDRGRRRRREDGRGREGSDVDGRRERFGVKIVLCAERESVGLAR